LPYAQRIRLTRVHASPPGDVLFPPFAENDFVETLREDHPAGERDEHPFTFIDLERCRESAEA
jgi:dihydrofolate reductase